MFYRQWSTITLRIWTRYIHQTYKSSLGCFAVTKYDMTFNETFRYASLVWHDVWCLSAGDHLSPHNGQRFVTRDKTTAVCPGSFSGGFWFVPDHCYDEINLHRNWSRSSAGSALEWIEIELKGIELKIRPRNFQRGTVVPLL